VGLEDQVTAQLDALMGMGGANLPIAEVLPSADSLETRVLKLQALTETLRDILMETAREVDKLTNRLNEGDIV
jgi:hypothetical protein